MNIKEVSPLITNKKSASNPDSPNLCVTWRGGKGNVSIHDYEHIEKQ